MRETFQVTCDIDGHKQVWSSHPNGAKLCRLAADKLADYARSIGATSVNVEPSPRPILELSHNGDPYGSGFTATESSDGGHTWYYRGDIGAAPRRFWRGYARRNGYTLRES